MRKVGVHEYGSIDAEVPWATYCDDIPGLLPVLIFLQASR